MALTNYILQSLIGTGIFFGWGLGQLGEVRYVEVALFAVLVISAQVIFSRQWLQRFNYGPLEWLWRCCTDWQWYPLVKRP